MKAIGIRKLIFCPRFVLLAVILLIAAAAVPARAAGIEPLRLAVRIFQVPAAQTFEAERPDGQGGAFTIRVSGDVTVRFPRGTVLIPTDLAVTASASAIGEAIAHGAAFGCGDLVADRIQMRELKALDVTLDAGHASEQARFEESGRGGRTDDYELRVERLSGEAGKPLLRLRFFAGWRAQAGSLGVGLSSDVISAVAEVPEEKLLLIGATGEKAVYVLAVCARPR